jgi:hypothetical protein
MQLISVYLYPNKIDVFTNASTTWKTERYRRVYNRNIKIYRGVDNRIDIQVRNSDEKAADTTGSTLVFNLVERESQTIVAQKDCVIVDAGKGKFYAVLTEAEMLDIEQGFYQYSLYREQRTANSTDTYLVASRTPLYVDSQYDTLANIEVLDNGAGDVLPSISVSAFASHISYGEPFSSFYISSIIDARPQTTTPQSIHTFQMNFTNYTGEVVVQGSISEGGAPEVWADVAALTLDAATTEYLNVIGKYHWFRVKHTPSRTTSIAIFTIAQTLFGNYVVSIGNAGSGYVLGDVILIRGDRLGGESASNDLTITVSGLGPRGSISAITQTGISYNGVKTFVLSGNTLDVGTFDKIVYR